jgi:hypothetical protein
MTDEITAHNGCIGASRAGHQTMSYSSASSYVPAGRYKCGFYLLSSTEYF